MNNIGQLKVASQPRTVAALLRFDPISIALHWATVALVVVMFASAWGRELAGDGAPASNDLLTLHRSAGVTLWLVAFCRLGWRITLAIRPPLPASVPPMQVRASALTEGGLYILLIIQPITGLLQSFARGYPFQLFGFEIPKVMGRDKGLGALTHQAHELAAWLLLGLLALHIAAALLHGLVLKDGVLQSMLPRRRPKAIAQGRAAP